MKKQIRVSIIATMITCIIIMSCAYAMPVQAEADRGEFYPKLTVVKGAVRIESKLWVVECVDKAGNVWSFYDEEGEWERGDIANLMMWALSEDPFEDEIVEVYWEGFTKDVDAYRVAMGWK